MTPVVQTLDPITHNIESIAAFYKREHEMVTGSQRIVETFGNVVGRPLFLGCIVVFVGLWIAANVMAGQLHLAAFDPAAGGICCSRCSPPGALHLANGARLALAQLQQGGLEAAESPVSADGSGRPADAKAFEQAAAQAGPAMAAFLGHHLGRTLRSRSFLADVNAPL